MKTRWSVRLLIICGLLLISIDQLPAAHLPVKTYTAFDGLANDSVNKIVRDSRGFLWFCTSEGLSRFDGFEFRNYAQTHGLPHRNINDFLETQSGEMLIATTNGLAVFDPEGTAFRWNVLTSRLELTSESSPMFRTFHPPNPRDEPQKRSVMALAQSPDGRIFAGTATMLYRLEKLGDAWTFTLVEAAELSVPSVYSSLQFDSHGFLWVVAGSGVFRISPDSKVVKFDGDGGGSVLADSRNRVWVGGSGTDSGLRLFTISDDGSTAALTRIFRKSDGLPIENSMAAIKETADGRILAVVGRTLCEYLPLASATEPKFRVIARGGFQTLVEDVGGSLWLGTTQEGAWKIAQTGFLKFDESDGIPADDLTSLFTNSDGELFLTSGKQRILHLVDGRFEVVVPGGLGSRSWSVGQLDIQSSTGEWLISSYKGLRVYPRPATFGALAATSPSRIYTTSDGLFGNEIFNLFEDSRGDIWFTSANNIDSLQRLERKTGKLFRYTTAEGLPASNGALAFTEDAAGDIWFGFYFGGLARYKNGEFRFFDQRDGIPVGSIHATFIDKRGRLWVASASRGVFRADDPTGDDPKFINISTAEGLSSNLTNCITEDDFGQIYVGTGNGLNRINPDGNGVKLYSQADGLPGSVVSLCRRDLSGALWFVSRNNLAKFVPQMEVRNASPGSYIGAVTVNGTALKLSELGVKAIEGLDFAADQKQIRIDFFALGFGADDQLRYQYRLGENEWSAAAGQKSVTFNLESGDYRFEVRAVNTDSATGGNPAVVSFSIAPPFYRRWWFVLTAALFLGGVVLIVERSRAARLRGLRSAFGKLAVSENRFRQMNDQSPLGIIVFAPDGSIRAVNRAYEEFWGVTFDEIKKWDFLNDEQLIRLGVVEKMRRVFAGETVHFPPEPYDPREHAHGHELNGKAVTPWFESFAYPVKNDAGELLEVILVMEDVTDTKRADEIERTAKSERLRELEQVRRRIAADLHDDIGSSLTQISIYSEVLQQRVDKSNEQVVEPLEFIAASSRELVDAMSDIVWAINPQKDFLSELSGKMRRFASDVFAAKNIDFTYEATPGSDIALGANLRREVFLIFKESVNNIVKHARCRKVEIKLVIGKSVLVMSLSDDGVGFNPAEADIGHGLVSMRARAKGLGGQLTFVSDENRGTSVSLSVPLVTDDGPNN